MPRHLEVKAYYDGDPDQIFAQAMQFQELIDAMAGLATYVGLPDKTPSAGDTYVVDVTLWKFFKTKNHTMHVESLDWNARLLQSREHNPNVKRWDHLLSVQPDTTGVCWTDSVVIDAGWQTPITTKFASHVYLRRHRFRRAKEINWSVTKL